MKIGINYGQHTLGGAIDLEEVRNDLQNLWNIGIRRIRVAVSAYNGTSGVNASKQIVQIAKSIGHYVTWGVGKGYSSGIVDFTSDASPGNLEDWDTFAASFTDTDGFVDWAASNGVDELMLGNELEAWTPTGTELTAAQIYTKVMELGSYIKSNKTNFLGKLTVSVSQDYAGEYKTNGLGDVDYMNYHAYGSEGGFQAQCDLVTTHWGSDGYIGEWNFYHPWSEANGKTAKQFRYDNKSWLNILLNSSHFQTYFFTYRWDTSNDQFAVRKSNGYINEFILDLVRANEGYEGRDRYVIDNSGITW